MLRLQAFPLDELDPVHCTGRGVDRDNPENINVNDVLGNYSLGLIDSLDTIALMVRCLPARRSNLTIAHFGPLWPLSAAMLLLSPFFTAANIPAPPPAFPRATETGSSMPWT